MLAVHAFKWPGSWLFCRDEPGTIAGQIAKWSNLSIAWWLMTHDDVPFGDSLSPRSQYAHWLGAIENRRGPLDDKYDALLLKVTTARDKLGINGLENFWVERFRTLRKKAEEDSSAAFTKGLFWGFAICGALIGISHILR